MPVCHASIVDRVSESWLYVLTRLVGRKPEDEMRRATMLLNDSIRATSGIEQAIGAELQDLATKVRTMRSRHIKADLNAVLLASRHKRIKLQQTTKKRIALERHLETLNSTLLNQQVMSSVKQTSEVLKAMGLEKELEQIDSMNVDLEDTLSDARAIQSGLSERVGEDYEDDIDLEEEMNLLLEQDAVETAKTPTYASVTAAPDNTHNSMNSIPEARETVCPEPVQARPLQQTAGTDTSTPPEAVDEMYTVAIAV